MRADAESSTVRLLVAGTKKQPVPMFIGGNLTIVESDTVVGEQHGGVGHLGLRHFAALLLPLGHLWLMIVCARSLSSPPLAHSYYSFTQPSISRSSIKGHLSHVRSSLRLPKPFAFVFNELCARSRQKPLHFRLWNYGILPFTRSSASTWSQKGTGPLVQQNGVKLIYQHAPTFAITRQYALIRAIVNVSFLRVRRGRGSRFPPMPTYLSCPIRLLRPPVQAKAEVKKGSRWWTW